MASNLICVVGNPGTGKSTSLENLDHNETCIVTPVGKPLPFKGSKSKYNSENKNYLESDDYAKIIKYMKHVSDNMPKVKNLVLDDIGLVMGIEFMSRALESGYNKFSEIGHHMFSIINTAKNLRDDLNIVFMFHSEDIVSDGAVIGKKIKTAGKILDGYFTPAALFSILLYTKAEFNKKDNTTTYNFVTNYEKLFPAKSPKGMFEEQLIANDLKLVIDTSREYYA